MQQQPGFEVLYEDDYYVAINKPFGWLVHRTRISEDTDFVLQRLRNQLQQRIYPVHRLDRATSGVLVFGKSSEAARALGIRFQDRDVEKQYLAIIRGYVPERDTIDYPLADDAERNKERQPAITHYQRLAQSEIPFAIGRYPTARFSLVSITPETGRRQQIRKHFAHIFHPIIGDRRHGDVKHNAWFRDVVGIPRMLLHARLLSFVHPETGELTTITAELDEVFVGAMDYTGLALV